MTINNTNISGDSKTTDKKEKDTHKPTIHDMFETISKNLPSITIKIATEQSCLYRPRLSIKVRKTPSDPEEATITAQEEGSFNIAFQDSAMVHCTPRLSPDKVIETLQKRFAPGKPPLNTPAL